MSAIRVEGLAKRWPGGAGLRPTSLELPAGELVVVRGRSGSGKSTLLALLAGWCAPDEGRVVADPPLEVGAGPTPWRTVAVVPQVLALVPELTLRENVVEVLAGRRRREVGADVDALLDALDLTHVAGRPPAATSMGQQQRAAVARAVVARPRLLLADEPTSHQDAGHVTAVVAALERATAGGTAVLVATHDPAVAAGAHRVVDLDA